MSKRQRRDQVTNNDLTRKRARTPSEEERDSNDGNPLVDGRWGGVEGQEGAERSDRRGHELVKEHFYYEESRTILYIV